MSIGAFNLRTAPVTHGSDDASERKVIPFAAQVLIVLVAAIAFRAWVAGTGWFYADDLSGVGRAYTQPFLDTVLYREGGHIALITNSIGWVAWRLLSYHWLGHVAWMMTSFGAAALLLLSLLVRLFGRQGRVLVIWAGFLLSSALSPSLMWLSQAGVVVGLLIPSLLGAHAYLSYVTTQRRRWLAWTGLALLLGFLANERVLLLLPELVALVMISVHGRVASLRVRPVGLTLGVIAVPLVALYLSVDSRSAALTIAWPEAVALMRRSLMNVWLPTMAGGPWSLDEADVLPRAVQSNPMWGVALLMAAAVLVLGFVRVGPRALVASSVWLLFGLIDIAGVVWARYGSLGDAALVEWRYYSHTAVPLALLLGILFAAPRADPARHPKLRRAHEIHSRSLGILGIAIATGWLAGSLYTTLGMVPSWSANPARPYLSTTLAELSRTPRPQLVDRQLPSWVVPPELTYATRASWVLAGAVPRPAWDEASTSLLSIDDAGRLGPVVLVGGVTSRVGPEPDCGWSISGPTKIPLNAPLFDWNWVMEIGYLSSGWMTVPLSVNGHEAEIPIARGVGQTQLPFRGEIREISIGPVPDGSTLCVDRLRIGEGTAQGSGVG